MKDLSTGRTALRFAATSVLAGGLLTGAGGLLANAGASADADLGNGVQRGTQAYTITASHGGMDLGVADASRYAGARIAQRHPDGGADQKWLLDEVTDPYGVVLGYLLRNENSGQCLTFDGYASDAVAQQPCDALDDHQWYRTLAEPGGGTRFTNADGDLFLDVAGDGHTEGATVDLWYDDQAPDQTFRMVTVTTSGS
jgi:Ricin-type beta-trefoil lectin domain-like